jgi:outer membrane murein-binding lipoprotein Lpp
MTITRRRIFELGILCTLTPWSIGADAQIAVATAINRAGRFRALAQRSVKAYAQLVLDITPGASRNTLAQAQQLMAQGLDDLSKAGLGGEAASTLLMVRQDVAALSTALSGTPSKANLPKLSIQADKLTAAADKLTSLVEAGAKQGGSRIVNIAGRQRMLSQRMAKNYLLTVAVADSKALRDELAADRVEFKKALAALEAAPVSTLAIRNDLQQLQNQWTFLEAAISRAADPETLRTVSTASERVLELANNLTVQYEAALKDVLGTT